MSVLAVGISLIIALVVVSYFAGRHDRSGAQDRKALNNVRKAEKLRRLLRIDPDFSGRLRDKFRR